ncbi:hypothetical protein AX14_010052 [Amanita brunnescens Koide BX004]|nr:hypothetical protein AX14_010052 [Amanita brunnescens Koide BX004]
MAHIDEVDNKNNDTGSDASSELCLSYLDDLPLKQRFPTLRPPTAPSAQTPVSAPKKPLTITLPASGSTKQLRSVMDVLRELKNPDTTTVPPPDTLRFGGGKVAYSASALQAEASNFAAALATSNIASQPSPPPTAPAAPCILSSALAPLTDHPAPTAMPQNPTNLHD